MQSCNIKTVIRRIWNQNFTKIVSTKSVTKNHIYIHIISSDGQSIIATASTISREIKKDLSLTSNKEAAALVGKLIAEKSKSKGIEKVAFDRSGFKYHGRVKALAEAAREAGLNF